MPSSQFLSRTENLLGSRLVIAVGSLLAGGALYASSTRVPSAIIKSTRSEPLPDDLEYWIITEKPRALRHLLAAFGPDGSNAPGTVAGVMVASPSRPGSYHDKETENEDYFFHWTRDANLCLQVVIRKLSEAESGVDLQLVSTRPQEAPGIPSLKRALEVIVRESVTFNGQLQQVLNLSGGPLDGGLGEPKFLVDGSRFDGPWRRPQNDGPAIRASAMIQYARHLISRRPNLEQVFDFIAAHLYHRDNPQLQIQLDIDHVCRSWSEPSSDLWEEVEANYGGHFYTLMVQRKSVQDFLDFTRSLPSEKQPSDQEYYLATLAKMDERLEHFWNPEGLPAREGGNPENPNNSFVPFSTKPHILPTLDRVDGQPKPSQVDTAVLLAVNHTAGSNQPQNWLPSSDRVLATLDRLVEVFEQLYPINRSKQGTGIAIGRYPEDEYDGVKSSSVGHPWFLCTHAVAETTYLAISDFRKTVSIPVTRFNLAFFSRFLPELGESFDRQTPLTIDRGTDEYAKLLNGMSKWADRFLVDVTFKYFDSRDGRMSEQIDRNTGQMRGARELTWSYASLLSALDAREGKTPNHD
ncbi:hypothetical protein PGT21_032330 [Puccinia graminis f. sp. tritici]|uniref:GH15-like domain-containing protein n=1 Tax=Puccinia graminis f. sp. tritici TaxID=56615 RepID=A0A5B0SE03_PUCGR|nr:hypothetical protein PGTUg99_004515 [Puccinia graminis f. sp. tritici]KAA1094895.1 hypothetical protein PGT21_032330 [Puccinia graminis f. sp. tritici]KAA1135403.1 hypothetical protein PGTUg99_022353 [Puccinia graminis f. sp. tritici]